MYNLLQRLFHDKLLMQLMCWFDYSRYHIVFKAVQFTGDHIHLFGAVSLWTFVFQHWQLKLWETKKTHIPCNDTNSFAQLTYNCIQFIQMFGLPALKRLKFQDSFVFLRVQNNLLQQRN